MSKRCKDCDMKCEGMCHRDWEPLDGGSFSVLAIGGYCRCCVYCVVFGMSKADWSKAPEEAEFYAVGNFYKNNVQPLLWNLATLSWTASIYSVERLINSLDYEPRPTEWPSEQRIEQIGQNGNTGEHYQAEASKFTHGAGVLHITEEQQPPKTSAEYLSECLRVQTELGKQYDASGTGERSFAAAAAAFNAVTGQDLKGSDVCLILEMVKLVRQYSSPTRLHADSVLDKVSYSSLWAEKVTKELAK